MIKFNIIGEANFPFKTKRVIKKMLKFIVKYEQLKTNHIISYVLVDSEQIQAINNQYRKINQPTDVISFAYYEDKSILPYELGDIFINIDDCYRQAQLYDHSVLREFTFLAIHGTLHLIGYDHQKPSDEKEMFGRQEEILKVLKIERK